MHANTTIKAPPVLTPGAPFPVAVADAAVPVADPVELGPLEPGVVLPVVAAAAEFPLVLPALAWLLPLVEALAPVVVTVPVPLLAEPAV